TGTVSSSKSRLPSARAGFQCVRRVVMSQPAAKETSAVAQAISLLHLGRLSCARRILFVFIGSPSVFLTINTSHYERDRSFSVNSDRARENLGRQSQLTD